MYKFIDRLCEAVLGTDGGDSESRSLIGRGIADTVAVAAGGFAEAVTRSTIQTYGGTGDRAWSGAQCESREAAVMINAIAAHALDFDDVYLEALVHPGAVVVPAVLQLGYDHDADSIIAAVAAGLIAARAIGAHLGQSHLARGWHCTGTVGVFAATAAAGKLTSLSMGQMRNAFGLAAAMSGGLQRNFATMAKSCQAGFAAAGGVRAARLAAVDIEASNDVFGSGGYFDIYGDAAPTQMEERFSPGPDCISVKLYPCCYAASRLIGIALDARRAMGPIFNQSTVRMKLEVPRGSIAVLRCDNPADRLQAKFSAPYTVSAALLDGIVGIEHFEESAIARKDIRDCMQRLTICEDDSQESGGELTTGTVRLRVFRNQNLVASYSRSAIPGSPQDAPSVEQIRSKSDQCFSIFERQFGHRIPILGEIEGIDYVAPWVGVTHAT